MIFTIGLKRICDISFYFTFATFLVAVLGGDNLISVLPIFTIVAFLSAYLAKSNINKYVSLLPLGLLCFVVPLALVNIIAIIPAVVYTIIKLPKPNERINQFEYDVVFGLFLKLFAGMIILSFLVGVVELLENGPLLFSLAFLCSSVILMRLSRHDEAVLKSAQLQIINAVSLVGVIIVVFLFSTDAFLTLLQKTIAWIWLSVVVPILQFFLSIFISILAFIFSIFNIAQWNKVEEVPNLVADGIGPAEVEHIISDGKLNLFNPFPIIALVIVIIIFHLIFKTLSQDITSRASTDGVEEERIMLDSDKRKKKRKRKFTTGNPIRDIYRKVLQKLDEKGHTIPNYFTSNDVDKLIKSSARTDKASKLRDVYVQVRYAGADYTKEQVKMVKKLYKEIMKEMED